MYLPSYTVNPPTQLGSRRGAQILGFFFVAISFPFFFNVCRLMYLQSVVWLDALRAACASQTMQSACSSITIRVELKLNTNPEAEAPTRTKAQGNDICP